MQKITPFLWFNDNAEEALAFYASVFKNTKAGGMSRYGEGAPLPAGAFMSATLTIEDQDIMVLNGGPIFSLNPAMSFFVYCATVGEIDELWKKLSEGGKVMMELQKYPFSEKYGWLNDKYGVSWQLMLGTTAHKITPFLFFCGPQNGKAEEAMKYYASVFKYSRIDTIARYGAGLGQPENAVVHAEFSLDGQPFMAMENNGPHAFTFSEATSLFVSVDTQEEVDELWEKLSAGGQKSQCGWLKDKFGLSWQIIPKLLGELLSDPDKAKSQRVMMAMLQMRKIDVQGLQRAAEGK